jgi:hypothetical protein
MKSFLPKISNFSEKISGNLEKLLFSKYFSVMAL